MYVEARFDREWKKAERVPGQRRSEGCVARQVAADTSPRDEFHVAEVLFAGHHAGFSAAKCHADKVVVQLADLVVVGPHIAVRDCNDFLHFWELLLRSVLELGVKRRFRKWVGMGFRTGDELGDGVRVGFDFLPIADLGEVQKLGQVTGGRLGRLSAGFIFLLRRAKKVRRG